MKNKFWVIATYKNGKKVESSNRPLNRREADILIRMMPTVDDLVVRAIPAGE